MRAKEGDNGTAPDGPLRNRLLYGILLALAAMTAMTYLRTASNSFVPAIDDDLYVTANPVVQQGLTLQGAAWAFTTGHAANWHPMTWLSHMLDVSLFGADPGMHHLASLLFHVGNALLLFLLLYRMTGGIWRSAFAAALFAVHPLHVESVAWVSERKDVLSAFFLMLTLWAYFRYVKEPGVRRYLPVFLFLALGLMAKPMLVTTPFLLLLLDYWPLGRFGTAGEGVSPRNAAAIPFSRLLLEKAPLFLLSVVSCGITYVVQQKGGTIDVVESYPLAIRAGNALLSYASYLGKMFWPSPLAAFYPHPGRDLPWIHAAGAGIALLLISFLAVRQAGRRPYLAVGWLWYLGTLVPVIGIVQVGGQAMADRYTYVPLVGLSLIAAWGGADLVRRWRVPKPAVAVTAAATLSALMALSWNQTKLWKDSYTLLTGTLEVTSNNWLAHYDLGLLLEQAGKPDEAIAQYREALKARPGYSLAHNNLGMLLRRRPETLGEAVIHFRRAVESNPGDIRPRLNLGVALRMEGRDEEAVLHYREALRIRPDSAQAHYFLGKVLQDQGELSEAAYHYGESLRYRPGDPVVASLLRSVLSQGKR